MLLPCTFFVQTLNLLLSLMLKMKYSPRQEHLGVNFIFGSSYDNPNHDLNGSKVLQLHKEPLISGKNIDPNTPFDEENGIENLERDN